MRCAPSVVVLYSLLPRLLADDVMGKSQFIVVENFSCHFGLYCLWCICVACDHN